MNAKLEQLQTRLGEIDDFRKAAALLRWDQQVNMPPGGAEARATQLATLLRTAHERFVSDETGQLLADLESELAGAPYDAYEASLVRVTRREYDRDHKIPADLVTRLAKARSLGQVAWEKARTASDFAIFLPSLETNVELAIELAETLGYEERIYDALLDRFEPEMKTAQVEVLFEAMKSGLVPLIQAIAERQGVVDDSVLKQPFDESKQGAFGLEVIRRLGFDFECGREDRSVHPFTTSFSPGDVRLTTRIIPDQFKSALFATIHEAGHGMYEQGFARCLDRTPLSDGASLGVHESQSRMWENVVGRSRAFWTFWLPRLKEYFPRQLDGVGVEAFYRAINRVEPWYIRVEADEVTYNLHIFLRFQIENMMLERKVPLTELPDLWNARMEEYLGVRPRNDVEGVLQDVHWSSGLIGYFPTYSLGNLLSVLFYEQALSDRPEILSEIERGEFSSLLSWLRAKIHRPGATYTPAELVRRVTGGPIRTEPFLNYVREKYADIYGL
jgi:carboxypeptidase Taq